MFDGLRNIQLLIAVVEMAKILKTSKFQRHRQSLPSPAFFGSHLKFYCPALIY